MAYGAEIVADSISPSGDRLTTLEVTFPRMVLAEFNTHRVLSRNSASSRAIPVATQLRRILDDPFVPNEWGANRPGMQASEVLPDVDREMAVHHWQLQRDIAIIAATAMMGGVDVVKDPDLVERLHKLLATHADIARCFPPLQTPLHKQIASRPLEPYMWHTVVVTATEWENFFALRDNPAAQPEIRRAAQLMREAMRLSTPRGVSRGEWHTPFILDDERELPIQDRIKMAVGRAARVSYLTHDGRRAPEKDITLHNQLREAGHMSPFEHVARPMTRKQKLEEPMSGNFRGWQQYRKLLKNEGNYQRVLDEQE